MTNTPVASLGKAESNLLQGLTMNTRGTGGELGKSVKGTPNVRMSNDTCAQQFTKESATLETNILFKSSVVNTHIMEALHDVIIFIWRLPLTCDSQTGLPIYKKKRSSLFANALAKC